MTTDKFLQEIEDNFNTALDLIRAKNKDYATQDDPFKNFNNFEKVGVPVERGILVRMMDKITRISNLLDKEVTVKDETMTDSILDLINYANILKVYIDNKKSSKIFL